MNTSSISVDSALQEWNRSGPSRIIAKTKITDFQAARDAAHDAEKSLVVLLPVLRISELPEGNQKYSATLKWLTTTGARLQRGIVRSNSRRRHHEGIAGHHSNARDRSDLFDPSLWAEVNEILAMLSADERLVWDAICNGESVKMVAKRLRKGVRTIYRKYASACTTLRSRLAGDWEGSRENNGGAAARRDDEDNAKPSVIVQRIVRKKTPSSGR